MCNRSLSLLAVLALSILTSCAQRSPESETAGAKDQCLKQLVKRYFSNIPLSDLAKRGDQGNKILAISSTEDLVNRYFRYGAKANEADQLIIPSNSSVKRVELETLTTKPLSQSEITAKFSLRNEAKGFTCHVKEILAASVGQGGALTQVFQANSTLLAEFSHKKGSLNPSANHSRALLKTIGSLELLGSQDPKAGFHALLVCN